jgi:hypothetical protein
MFSNSFLILSIHFPSPSSRKKKRKKEGEYDENINEKITFFL